MRREQLPEQQARYGRTADAYPQGTRPVSRTRQPVRHLPPGSPPANPHRAGHYAGVHPEDAPYSTGDMPEDEEDEDESLYPQPSHTSVRRYDYPQQPTYVYRTPVVDATVRKRATREQETDQQPAGKPRHRGFQLHWLAYVGFGMVAMLLLWVALSFVAGWYSNWQDDLRYGNPRTFQLDAVVGHNDSPQHPTHFIALNLNGQIDILEAPGGNMSKAKVYQGPTLFGQGASLAPVTLSFIDTQGNGHPDMEVHFQGSEIIYQNKQVNGTWIFVPQH